MFGKKNKKNDYKITLYVESKAIETKKELQKDIDLKDLLTNHVQYIDNEEYALKNGYLPLNFATTLRTIYTNRVVVNSKSGLPFFNFTEILPVIHKGYDLIMYLSSLGIINAMSYSKGVDELMLKSSFQCIGLFNPDPVMIKPMVYSCVYVNDDIESEVSKYLKEDYTWEDIYKSKECLKDGIFGEIAKSLIITERKEKEDNEK